MPILKCVFSSSRHMYGILSVGVPFVGVQHVRPDVILLLQCQSSQFNNPLQNPNLGLIICCLVLIKLICCVQIRVVICWKWIGLSATMPVLCHVLLYPFLTVIDSFIYIFLSANCPCCHIIVHFHWLDLGPQVNVWPPY